MSLKMRSNIKIEHDRGLETGLEKFLEFCKKLLDNWCVFWYYTRARSGRGAKGHKKVGKKIDEKRKKFLTMLANCGMLNKLSAKNGKHPVPCKLNNAKTNKHLDNKWIVKAF